MTTKMLPLADPDGGGQGIGQRQPVLEKVGARHKELARLGIAGLELVIPPASGDVQSVSFHPQVATSRLCPSPPASGDVVVVLSDVSFPQLWPRAGVSPRGS
jgi:hypothetical protein